MNSTSSLLVPLPEINRHQHSLFVLNATAVGKWLDTLPRANLGETTRRLYQALGELSHVRCKGKDRFDILEKFRPHVHYITDGLAQHYLNKAIVLPEKAEKIVLLADTLNTVLAQGYCQAFIAMELESRLLKPKETMAACLHRAMTEHASVLLRTYQLYRSPGSRFWLNLHNIFHAAQLHKLERAKISDKSRGSGTLEQAYLRPLMLACSRCHQMPQRYMEQVFVGLNYWTAHVELRNKGLESCVFLLDPEEDRPPLYRELANRAPAPGWLGIDTRALQGGSAKLLHLIPPSSQGKSIKMPESLLAQLSIAWSAATVRASERIPCNETALITVGMNPTHYYAANQMPFEQFEIDGNDAHLRPDPYSGKTQEGDPWSQISSHDTREVEGETLPTWGVSRHGSAEIENIDYRLPQDGPVAGKAEAQYSYLRARLLDSSSNGYRIEWPDSPTLRIRTGEVIGIKTNDYDSWRVAIVRWLRSDDSHQMGVEVVASAATPYSARPVQAGLPVEEFQRALLVPSDPQNNDARIMLTSTASFSAGQTVELVRPGHVMRIKLGDCLDSSTAFKLFSYRDQGRTPPVSEGKLTASHRDDEGEADFHKIWDIL